MSAASIGQDFFEESIRLEKLIWIPAMLTDCSAFPDVFEEFVDDLSGEEGEVIFTQLPRLREVLNEARSTYDYSEKEYVAEWLVMDRIDGFFFEVARPVFNYKPDGKMASFSWGHYHTAWLYAPSMDGVVLRALEQSSLWDQADKARALKARGEP